MTFSLYKFSSKCPVSVWTFVAEYVKRGYRSNMIFFATWAVSVLMGVLPFLGFSVYQLDALGIWCHMAVGPHVTQSLFFAVDYVCFYAIPVIIVVICYVKVKLKQKPSQTAT